MRKEIHIGKTITILCVLSYFLYILYFDFFCSQTLSSPDLSAPKAAFLLLGNVILGISSISGFVAFIIFTWNKPFRLWKK